MKATGRKSITCSFKADRRLADIIETSGLSFYTLVEAGLLSMAKQPGSRNDQLLQEAIRLEEDHISFHQKNLADLLKMKDNLPAMEQTHEPGKAIAAPKKFYNPEVRYYLKNINTRERRELDGREYEALEDKENWRPENE